MTRAGPLLATAAGVVATVLYGFGGGGSRAFSYAAVVTVGAGLAVLLDRSVGFSPAVRWGLAAAGLAHLAGGVVPVDGVEGGILYNAWLLEPLVHVDQAAHGIGYGVATVAAWQALTAWFDPGRQRVVAAATLAALAASGLGALNEAFEFAATFDLGGTAVGGYDNTGFDLVFDLGGALAAAVYLSVRHRPTTDAPRHR